MKPEHLIMNTLYGLVAWTIMISCSMLALQEIREPEPLTVSQCLMMTQDREALRFCLGPVVEEDDWDLYQRRDEELMWKTEAY